MTFNPSAANPSLADSLPNYRANLAQLGIGGGGIIQSPAGGGLQDWMDFPQVVQAFVNSFPHNGPMDKRTDDWEAQTEPSRNPNTKRPKGPGESVIMS